MDEIDYKLKTNNNILISSAISKLVLAIKNIESSEKAKTSAEFKLLQESCMSSNPLLSITSCHGMMILAQDGALEFNYIVSTILSSALSSKFYSGVISALGQLLIMDMKNKIKNSVDEDYVNPFNINSSQHPFVTILMKRECAWNDILNQIDTILNDETLESKHQIEFLRPVLLHILINTLNPTENKNRLQVWKLLLRELNSTHVQKIIIETLMWSKIELESNSSFISILCIELLERAILLDLPQLYMPIVPYLISLVPNLLKLGVDPKPTIVIISKVLQEKKSLIAVDHICMILAESISICPSVYLHDLILLCDNILHVESVNFIAVHTLVSSILQWMAYSSCLTTTSLKKALELKQFIEVYSHTTSKNVSDDYPLFQTIKHFSATLLKYDELAEISIIFQKDTSALNNFLDNLIQNNNRSFLYEIRTYLFGIFVCNFDGDVILKALKLLLSGLKENNRLALSLLTLVLYKLSHECNVNVQIELLRSLPEMAIIKENIPLIVHTISCLKKGPISLQSLCIDLQMRLCNVDIRCYPYLQESLVEKYTDTSSKWYIDIAKAVAIRELCLNRPEHHGSELVAHISQLLNRCTDTRSAFPASIALESISYLCKAGVVDIVSTWQALSPRLNNEKRPRVIVSLCKLFGMVPLLNSDLIEHQNLTEEIISKLWSYVTDYNEKEIIESALEALSTFSIEDIQLKDIPEEFKQNIKLLNINKPSQDNPEKNEEVLTFVPGECWIRLLQNINRLCIHKASDLISKWMSSEISQYRSGIYRVTSGKGEPNDCSNLPLKSIVRAVIEYVLEQSKKNFDNEPVLEHCLYILNKNYDKPLPPINWCCLHDLYHHNELYRVYCINIASKQMVISGSAKRFIENYLNDFDPENIKFEEIVSIFKNLPNFCKFLQPNALKKVIVNTLNFSLDKALSNNGNESDDKLFEQLLEHIRMTLISEDIQDDNRVMVAQTIEMLVDKIHQDDKLFTSLTNCCLELPILYFDRISSPTIWWETSATKFCKAVIIRSAMSVKHKNDEKALIWLNDIIDAGVSESNEQQNYILNKIISVMQQRHDETLLPVNCDWCLELMGQTQAELVKLKNDKSNTPPKNGLHFLCDVLMVTLESLSGAFYLVSNKPIDFSIKFKLFPVAISILSKQARWKDTIEQVIEWLYFMTLSTMIAPNYLNAFQKALIASKSHETFGKKHLWSKVIQESYFKIR